jgi:hypothetical protein
VPSPPLLIGTSTSGRQDTAPRESAAQAALAGLTAAGRIASVNLAFADEAPVAGAVETLPVLRRDALTVSGARGPRKPIVPEMIDALADRAERAGITRIAIVNGDIVVTDAAVVRAAAAEPAAVAIARTDIGGAADAELLHGVDMFAFDTGFWRRERHRFRAYILGEAVWDNVYAAIVVAHGGLLHNRERLILHERHPSGARRSPYERYIHLLAARDSSYFKLWCRYVDRAAALRARGGSAADEYALQREIFHPPGRTARAADVARAAWWRARRAVGA